MAITPTGPALTLELVSIVLLVFSVVTVAARVVVRRTIKALGSDDWLMIIGLVRLFHLVGTTKSPNGLPGILHASMPGNHHCRIKRRRHPC